MSTKFFNSTLPGNKIGDGTIKDLVVWLESFINISFPENGIDYWSLDRFGDEYDLKCQDLVPSFGMKDADTYHVACYVQEGHCEGERIQVLLQFRNGVYKKLTSAKTFGKSEDNWLIPRAVIAALESILLESKIPELVDMANKVPRQKRSEREAKADEVFTITTTPHSIKVTTANGLTLDDRSWQDEGSNAMFFVSSRQKDWQNIFTNLKANFSTSTDNILVTEDLPR